MQGLIKKMKTIHRDPSLSPSGLAPGTAKKTSSKRHILGGLLPGHGRMRSGHQSSAGSITSSLLQKHPASAILAVLAVLAFGLLFLMPGGPLQAQSAEQFFTYAENGTGPVATFTASDPEGATPSFWSLTDSGDAGGVVEEDIADRAWFKIDQTGVLSFKSSPPSYEGASVSGNDEYRVTVQVSDGSKVEYFKAYVSVTDVEETGKVTWTVAPSGAANVEDDIRLQQFQPGALLTARVTDADAVTDSNATGGITSDITWKWYRGSSAISGEAGDTYTVGSGDVGNRIRVEATYSDGSGPAETVRFVSENPVQAYSRLGDNTAPAFASPSVTRRVEENSTGNVGGPVTATDGNGDKLTYTITGGADTTSFKIDMATGQLMVEDDTTLDYETKDSYTVEVTATDSSGIATVTDATVTINVIDVDEKPTFDTGSVAAGVVAAQTEGRTVIDTDGDPADATDTLPATIVASDPEEKNVTLTLMGDDAASFKLADGADNTNAVRQVLLSFMEKPDFEMPGDRNRDNVYEVTVRASDGTMNADRALIIKVINHPTEGGKVTLSPEDAVVGVELTATLAHVEGGVAASGQIANQMWQWQRAAAPTDAGETCADVADGDWANIINDATDATYTPVRDDRDVEATPSGGCLSAMVTYTYQFMTTTSEARSVGTAVLVSQANQAPKFKDGRSTFRVVMENVEANTTDDPAGETDVPADNVGSAIGATDANGDTPIYTLGGADASLFRIRSDGQLEVKGALDHEMDSSHRVTVTANDGSGASNDSATITVTIYVTDVDEEPKIKDRADSTAEGMRTVDYRENSTGPVARFTASDPEDATPIVWSLTDSDDAGGVVEEDIADRAWFKIDQTGVLSFKSSPPSYEGASVSGNDEYRVTVQASDGNNNGYFELTVNVTDVEETGKITWTVTPPPDGSAISGLQQFQPGAVLTPTVTDPDAVTDSDATGGITSDITWKWYRGSSAISGEAGETYTVGSADVGNRIRVEATYSDGSGPAETVRFVSENPVQAVRPSGDNTAPAFASPSVTRRVEENSTGNVGGPVTATDGNGDKLTYTITGGADTTSFKIDMATGQLMVEDDTTLDYETKDSYTVEVTATDSSGIATVTDATVTINVIDVDEKPTFDTGSVAAGVVAAQTEGRTVIDTDGDPADATDTLPATIVASDPEEKNVTLTLMGDDAASFKLADGADNTNAVRQVLLSFMEKPDFEMPGDRNRDNVYEVTVRASDGTMNADRTLIIKVINNPDEGGKVTLSPEDAVVGVELTATLAHMEGGFAASGQIANQMWQWQRAAAPTDAGETCADVADGDWANIINDATDATYTPVRDDRDVEATPSGGCLSAMVTYTYQFMTTTSEARSVGTAVLVSQANQAPKFKDGRSTFRVVMESVEAIGDDDDDAPADNVGSPIVATDANGDTPTYTLGGADASLFRIRSDGQLEVKGKLDHEMDSSHTVTVTANDGSGASNDSGTITVTIYVTDVDEGPEIMVVPTENRAPMFRSSSTTRSILEGQSSGRPIGATVTATDLNPGDSLTYILEGTDAASFSIHSRTGQLRTSDPLDQGTKSTYTVTVRATDRDGLSDTITVTITVTGAEEQMGEVTLWDGMVALTMAPQVGDIITGAVMDPDGGVTGESWQWSRSMDTADMSSWMPITGATDAAYTVTEDDADHYLRVMATYTDAVGTDMAMVYSMPTMMVGAMAAEMTLLERYDDGDDGWIQLDEARVAVGDYFSPPKGSKLSLADTRKVVGLYFDYKNRQQ